MQEAGAIVVEIKWLVEASKVKIWLEYSKDTPRMNTDFADQPGLELMKKYKRETKIKCNKLINRQSVRNEENIGITIPFKND